MADSIKNIGFKYATRSGVTIAVSDLNVPELRMDILDTKTKEGRYYRPQLPSGTTDRR